MARPDSPPESRWDSFVETCPRGQFQQTSGWARTKAIERWQAFRVTIPDRDGALAGGVQVLWRQTRFGRVGYASKGPVLQVEDAPSIDEVLRRMSAQARAARLRAIILQPPDYSRITAEDLGRNGFASGIIPSVIRATGVIDVLGGREVFHRGMNRQVRREARVARERGVTLRLGDRSDLGRFFELMRESSRRQGSAPNPARVEALEALWDAFAPHMLLGLAEHEQQVVSALLMIGHGSRLTFWKKGWDARATRLYANALLNVEALGWACDRGYREVDFVGLDPDIANTLLAGQPLTEAQQKTRHLFNLRLGARPVRLPPARLLVLHPVLRALHRWAGRSEALNRQMVRIAKL